MRKQELSHERNKKQRSLRSNNIQEIECEQANNSFISLQSNEIALKDFSNRDKSRDMQDISFDQEPIYSTDNFAYQLQQKSVDKSLQNDRFNNITKLLAKSNKSNIDRNHQKLDDKQFKLFGDKTDYQQYIQYLKTDKKKSQEQFFNLYQGQQQKNTQKRFKKKQLSQDKEKSIQHEQKKKNNANTEQYKAFSFGFGLASASQTIQDGKIDIYDALDFISQDKRKKVRSKNIEKKANLLDTIKEERNHHLQHSIQESKIQHISNSFEDFKLKFQEMINQQKQDQDEQDHIEKELFKIESQFFIKSQIRSAASNSRVKNKKSPDYHNLKLEFKKSPEQFYEQKNISSISLANSQQNKSPPCSKIEQIDLKIKNLQSKVRQASYQQKYQKQQMNSFLNKFSQNKKKNFSKEQNLKSKVSRLNATKNSQKKEQIITKNHYNRQRTFSGLQKNYTVRQNLQKTMINPAKNITTRTSYKESILTEIKQKQSDFKYSSPFQLQLSQLRKQKIFIKQRRNKINTQQIQRKSSYSQFDESQFTQMQANYKSEMEKTLLSDPINNSDFVYMNYQVAINARFIKHDDVFKPVLAEIFIKNNCKFDIEDLFGIVYGPHGSNLVAEPKRIFFNTLGSSQQKKIFVWFSPEAVDDRGFQLQLTYLRYGIRKKISLKVNLPLVGFIIQFFQHTPRKFLEKYNKAKKQIYVAPKKLKINQIRWYEQVKSKMPLIRIIDSINNQNITYGIVFKHWSCSFLVFLKIICMPQSKIALCLRTQFDIIESEQIKILGQINEVLFSQ